MQLSSPAVKSDISTVSQTVVHEITLESGESVPEEVVLFGDRKRARSQMWFVSKPF
jgi:hypothetical protein